MIGAINQGSIAAELSAISQLTRGQLIEGWKTAHRRPPPKGISRRLLEYSAAYQLQVKTFGGLKPAVRRKLYKATEPGGKSTPTTIALQKAERLYLGARLLREWHGRTYTVEVINDGYRFEDETYQSLSQVARSITGARWSGPRFFGL